MATNKMIGHMRRFDFEKSLHQHVAKEKDFKKNAAYPNPHSITINDE